MLLLLTVATSAPALGPTSNPSGLMPDLRSNAIVRVVEAQPLLRASRFTKTSDIRLLAMTCTAEAESEPKIGKILVMATLINRAENNGTTLLTELRRPHQFPWWGRTRRIIPECESLARSYVLTPTFRRVTHFHHRRIRPVWARHTRVLYAVGQHIFYQIER